MSARADVIALVRQWIAKAEEKVDPAGLAAASTNDYFHIVVEKLGR